MDISDLANRMKEYEKRNQYYLQKRTPVAIRVDGRSFHTFTKGFQKPFDEILIKSMQDTAKYMCENMGNVKFAYTQSDEITIILIDYDKLETDCWFNYRTDKLCSIAASMATMAFNKSMIKNVTEYVCKNNNGSDLNKKYIEAVEKGAMFDARCFNIPKEEVCNLIYWRQIDAIRNSIQMVGQANFSHTELQGKSCEDIKKMLLEQKGIIWSNYSIYLQRGSACRRVESEANITGTKDTISPWTIDLEMPILKGEDRDYVDKLVYVGEK